MFKLGIAVSHFVDRCEKLSLLILMLLGLVFMIMWGDLKSSHAFHVDEIWQYSFANSYGQDTQVVGEEDLGKWLSPEIFRDFYTVQPGQEFSFKQIMESAEKDLHPPLSHILLNMVCSFFPNGFSKWYGLSINIVAYLVTMLVLFQFCKLVFATKLRALLATGMWAFSLGAVDTVMYIRMYCLLTLFSVCLFLFSVQYMRSGRKRYLLGIFLSLLLGGLTEYIFWILGFFATLSFVVFHYRGRMKRAVSYAGVALGALILACVIFPATVTQFTNSNSMTHYANEVFGLQDKLALLLDPAYALDRFLHFSALPIFGVTTATVFSLLKLTILLGLLAVVFVFFVAVLIDVSGSKNGGEHVTADSDVAGHLERGFASFQSTIRHYVGKLCGMMSGYREFWFVMLAVVLTTYMLAVIFPDFQEWTVRAFFYVFPFYAIVFAAVVFFLHDKLRVPVWALAAFVIVLFARSNTTYMSPFLLTKQYGSLETKVKDASVIMALDSEASLSRVPNFCPALSGANSVYLLLLNKATCAEEMFHAIHTAPAGHKVMVINTVGGPPENITAASFLGPEMMLTSNRDFMNALKRDGLGIKLVKKFGSIFQTFHLYEIERGDGN